MREASRVHDARGEGASERGSALNRGSAARSFLLFDCGRAGSLPQRIGDARARPSVMPSSMEYSSPARRDEADDIHHDQGAYKRPSWVFPRAGIVVGGEALFVLFGRCSAFRLLVAGSPVASHACVPVKRGSRLRRRPRASWRRLSAHCGSRGAALNSQFSGIRTCWSRCSQLST